ncbi:acyl-CoA synthetase bubblegum family member 2 [Phyllostomus discolor]|uniref:Acyl-CoA synthetase bubblegum family member 2 n=1 Tax=Phyllostomus discolor TaxID=89673 RepID=A0A833ZGA4_9CHIR|nr:acyl-CoA synthetase bubblegum family member 2 [Phyllostomus discolor]
MSKTKVPLNSGLWTIHADGEVLLRLSKHGPGHEAPITIPEFFRESVSRFGIYPALASKNSKNWEVLNFKQYYEACRKAARALIKVNESFLLPSLSLPPFLPSFLITYSIIHSE